MRLWPVVGLGLFIAIDSLQVGTFPLHSLQGVGIPFAVLATTGVASIRAPSARSWRVVIAGLAVTALVVPSMARELNDARGLGKPSVFGPEHYFLTNDEQSALGFIKNTKIPGAVLSDEAMGLIVPWQTARHTWVGSFSWTPDYDERVMLASKLFGGQLSAKAALRLVRVSGARILLADCEGGSTLRSSILREQLGNLIEKDRSFGCVTVDIVRP